MIFSYWWLKDLVKFFPILGLSLGLILGLPQNWDLDTFLFILLEKDLYTETTESVRLLIHSTVLQIRQSKYILKKF